MQSYVGVKLINAIPMSRLEYNEFRGWALPEDENGDDEGYLVEYHGGGQPNTEAYDGYVSWSPSEVFERAYRLTTGMNFGLAIEAMKKGFKVARTGWNGKGMFCIYVPGTQNIIFTEGTPYEKALGQVMCHEVLPHFDMYAVNSKGRRAMQPGWIASQSDMDADDWTVIA